MLSRQQDYGIKTRKRLIQCVLIADIANLRDFRIEMALLFIQIFNVKVINGGFKEARSNKPGGSDEQNVIVHKSLSLVIKTKTQDKDENLP